MKRSWRRIRALGLGNYIASKVYDSSPDLYFRFFASIRDGFVTTAYDVEMQENWMDSTFRMCVFGRQGNVLAELLRRWDRPFAFVDIGANQGLFSLIAAMNPKCHGVLAFEPVRQTFDILSANLARNSNRDKFVPIRAAVSSETGEAEIGFSESHSGGASLADGRLPSGGAETVRLVTASEIDPLVPSDVELVVKVDVEGYEPVVIAEILKLAAADRIRALFFEVDLRWIDYAALETLLRTQGFGSFERYGSRRHFDVLAVRADDGSADSDRRP